jgi:hypothetical protein
MLPQSQSESLLKPVSTSSEDTMEGQLLDYAATQVRNRETFLLNFGADLRAFEWLLAALRSTWDRLGKEKDSRGHSHAGLTLFANILVRHAILGFQHIASYQSFLAWLTFRPGLEAFLILGKLKDDPQKYGKIWKERKTNRKAYDKAFWGKDLISTSLHRSDEFRKILSRLNDEFMHPNPDFTYRDVRVQHQGNSVLVEIQFFDMSPESHEAHLLAYMNLFDVILSASEGLVNSLCGLRSPDPWIRKPIAELARSRAEILASRNPLAKMIMEELGLWQL